MSGAVPLYPRRPLGLWASLVWGAAAIAAWLAAQAAIGSLLIGRFDDAVSGDTAALAAHGPFVSLVTLGAALAPLAVVAAALRAARRDLSDYLGLLLPARNYVVLGVVAIAVLIPLGDAASWLFGYAVTPQFVLDLYSSARDSGALLLLVLAIVVAAPIVEETLFRGFLLPSFAASPLGVWGALLLTSAAWALLHAQYEPFYLVQIIVLGILFGWLRLASGSSLLTIGLHGLVNLVSILQAAATVEWMR